MERLTREPWPLRLARGGVLRRPGSGRPASGRRRKARSDASSTAAPDGIGAPKGERNAAYKHGLRSYEAIAQRRAQGACQLNDQRRSDSVALAKAGFDPLLPFKIGPTNGRKARESGLRLKASVASTGCSCVRFESL